MIYGASTLLLTNFWVLSTETLGGLYGCVAVGALPFNVQIVIHVESLPCQQNHCAVCAGSLQVLLSSRQKRIVRKLSETVFRLQSHRLYVSNRLFSTIWQSMEKHFPWQTSVGAMVCNYSSSGVETLSLLLQKGSTGTFFSLIYPFGIWQQLSPSTSTGT